MTLDSRIYIAGHRGMVGSAILRLLQKSGYSQLIVAQKNQLDLSNQQETLAFFEREKPEFVFLAAARVGGIHANNTYRAEFFYENLMIAANVIHAAHLSSAKKLVNLGSSCIYPKLATQPLQESSLLTGALEYTNEPYAIAKIAAVKMCHYYHQQYDSEFLSLMPTNLYGPNDNYNLETSHVLPALIRKFVLAHYLQEQRFDLIQQNLSDEDLGFGTHRSSVCTKETCVQILAQRGIQADAVTLWGSGTVYREFLHADDVARAALYFMQNVSSSQAGEIVNIGTGRDGTIRDLAHSIASIVGYSGELIFDSTQPDGTPRKLLDVTKAQSLGWTASISLEDGLRAVIDSYMGRS